MFRVKLLGAEGVTAAAPLVVDGLIVWWLSSRGRLSRRSESIPIGMGGGEGCWVRGENVGEMRGSLSYMPSDCWYVIISNRLDKSSTDHHDVKWCVWNSVVSIKMRTWLSCWRDDHSKRLLKIIVVSSLTICPLGTNGHHIPSFCRTRELFRHEQRLGTIVRYYKWGWWWKIQRHIDLRRDWSRSEA